MSEGPFPVIVKKVKAGTMCVAKEAPGMMAFVAELSEPEALKECKAQAAAIMAYLTNRKDCTVEEYNAGVKVKMRVEHRLGEVLAETVITRGYHSPGHSGATPSLPEGIEPMQSSRAQRLAELPWESLEEKIDQATKEVSQTRVEKEVRQEQQREENVQLVQTTTPLSAVPGTFQTLAVDPPWDWNDEGDVSQFGRGRHEYAALTFEQLLELPVKDKADKNAHLYLWITNRSLPKGFALLEKWGFRYVTCLTWCKPSIGMGNYFRGSTEHVLFGVRGSLSLLRNDLGTWFQADRGKRHSNKPEAFYQMVETCSPGPWLEMFARGEARPGWITWGAEA